MIWRNIENLTVFAVNQYGENTGQYSKLYGISLSYLSVKSLVVASATQNPKVQNPKGVNLPCYITPVDASTKWGPHTSYLLLKLLCNNYPYGKIQHEASMKPLSASRKNAHSLHSTASLVGVMSQDHPLPLPETCYNNFAFSISCLPSQLAHISKHMKFCPK